MTSAPLNTCPCDRYDPGGRGARCSTRNRCEILTASSRPEFPFWIVVHVPETSIYAPGQTYVLFADAQGNPAFQEPPVRPGAFVRCRPPLCLPLGGLGMMQGTYRVARGPSVEVGYPLNDRTSIPVRAVYEPMGNDQEETFPALPLDVLFGSSRMTEGEVELSRVVPAGTYRRVFYPEPPFDAFFPPVTAERTIASEFLGDDFVLEQLDDVSGDSRVANVRRDGGLDGWRVWLVDRPSQRRISVLRTLSGTDATVQLYTSGEQRTPGGGLGDDVEAIVAPPASWRGVPRLVTRLFSGAGLKNLVYPPIPPPVAVAGVVAQPGTSDALLLGYAARVTFESEELTTNAEPSTLLRYATTVNTDDRGRFATVLPPGAYIATIEPAEGTGFAKKKEIVVVDRALTALTFQPPSRTIVRGRAVLTDGRLLSEADVLAIPNPRPGAPPTPLSVTPRPGRARTGPDGQYALELDPGPYAFSVVPKPGTGFPRVVMRAEVPSSPLVPEVELTEVRVPAPTRLAFTLRAPTQLENPIQNAVVRIFAMPTSTVADATDQPLSHPIEIGSAMSDSTGAVEILLAQEPR